MSAAPCTHRVALLLGHISVEGVVDWVAQPLNKAILTREVYRGSSPHAELYACVGPLLRGPIPLGLIPDEQAPGKVGTHEERYLQTPPAELYAGAPHGPQP